MRTTNELVAMIENLNAWEVMLEEVKAEVESRKDELKQIMLEENTEELEAGQYIIRYTEVLSNRFDSTAFKKVMPDVYKAFTKEVASRRFTISA